MNYSKIKDMDFSKKNEQSRKIADAEVEYFKNKNHTVLKCNLYIYERGTN